MRLDGIALRAGDALGVSLVIGCAAAPAGWAGLSPAERDQAAAVPRWRATQWLRGRAALKQVLKQHGRNTDTAKIPFPNSRLSLTHGGALSIAAGTEAKNVIGIGVDFETGPGPRPETARFFLSAAERAWLEAAPSAERSAHLRRLWTTKEALFKADPDNGDRAWTDYRLPAPGEAFATAHVAYPSGPREIAYVSFDLLEGTISIATCKAEVRDVRAH